jgi:hypothetical protein
MGKSDKIRLEYLEGAKAFELGYAVFRRGSNGSLMVLQ